MARSVAIHRKLLLPLLLIPLIGVGCIAWSYRPTSPEREFASNAPLLALPGVDLEHFGESIVLLDRAADTLADLQGSERERVDIRESLYPLSFLRSIADLEKARREFIGSGAREERNAYVEAQQRTLRTLRYDLARFERAFVRHVPESSAKYVAAGRVVDRTAILESISSMRQIIARLERDVRVRQWCTLGIFECSIPSTPAHASSDAAGGTRNIAEIREVRDLMADVLEQPDVRDGPLVETNESSCITRTLQEKVFSRYDERMPQNMPAARRTMIASDIRFLRVDRFPQVPLYAMLAERDIEYVLASPLHHYTCMYDGADAGRVAGVLAIREAALSSPLSTESEGDATDQLRSIERELARGVVHESNARAYVGVALDASERGELGAAASLRASELALALEYQTAATPDSLILLAKTELLDADAHTRGIPADLSAQNLFFSRSGFQNTFMTYNSSIYSESPLRFDLARVPASREPYVYLSELPDTPAVKERLVRDAREFIALLGHPF